MLSLNSFPYYDDYDASKGYHKILFHPAKPVQARELTQIQSILQEQIKRHGDHVFKNGTVVVPGHLFYDDKVKFLKLETVYNQTNIESYLSQLVGKQIKGDTNGITALVIHYDVGTPTDSTTIYIKYTSGAGTVKEFNSAETLTCPEIAGLTFRVLALTEHTGSASICTINDGIYYINGYFVGVAKQSVTISKYDAASSAIIGLDYIESVVTENEDDTLYDNAHGFSNYGAPGSHRLKISLTLGVKPYDYTLADTSEIKFIDLLKIKLGAIEYLKDETQYAEIEKWLARRTFDESGNYSVKPFTFSANHYRNNYRGQWVTNTPYLIGDIVLNGDRKYISLNQAYSGATAPTQTFGIQSDGAIYWNELPNSAQFINDGNTSVTSTLMADHVDANNKMVVETSPGKAYVNGFEKDFAVSTKSVIGKALASRQLSQAQLYAPSGSYVIVTLVKGQPNVTTNLTKLNLLNAVGTVVGTAWVRALEYLSGSMATPDTVKYKLFLFGIDMATGYNFTKHVLNVSSAVFTAQISATLIPTSGSVVATGTAVTGVGTYFDFELAVGDLVKVGATWTEVAAIVSPTSFTASVSCTTAAGSSLFVGLSELTKAGDYVIELPTPAIKTLRSSVGAIDMEYTISKYYYILTTGTTHVITLTNGETFLPTNHIVTLDTGVVATSVQIDAGYALDVPATTLTISGLVNNNNYKVLVRVKRTGVVAKEKSKTLATKTLTLIDTGTQKYTNKVISLTEADCIRLIKVTESGSPTIKNAYVEAGEVDITTHYYTFDNGQKLEYYDVGKISTTRDTSRPIRITFEYFAHSAGDYFSADSYSTIPAQLVGKMLVGGIEYFLPDCLDFRSRISDSGLDYNSAGGASISDPVYSDTTMSTSYSYYLPREDSLGIDDNGGMTYNVGGTFTGGMKLCDVHVAARTSSPVYDVKFSDDQSVNYTMQDIKNLDSRLATVEYYVALSELEKTTVNTSIVDGFGLEREKNGFLVDEFSNHGVSDVANTSYKASIDLDKRECRALSIFDGVHLIEPVGTTDSSRLANNYQLTGNIISLPYTEDPMISQMFASKSEIIQAYALLDFTGVMNVYPGTDSYTDEQSDRIESTNIMVPRSEHVSATTWIYGGTYGKWWKRKHTVISVGGTVRTSSINTVVKVTSDVTVNTLIPSPTLRARTLLVAVENIKPFTSMNVFLSAYDVNEYFTPCRKIEITTGGLFVGHKSSQQSDKFTERTTTINSYDVIQRGEVIACTTGSAVVVSDETIYDKVTATNKRILYVANVKGTISGIITGSSSLSQGTVVSSVAGTSESNSLGNMYGTIALPQMTFAAGDHKVLVTDAATSNINAASTLADAGFSTNGIVNVHSRYLNYDSQVVTTVKDTTTKTWSLQG